MRYLTRKDKKRRLAVSKTEKKQKIIKASGRLGSIYFARTYYSLLFGFKNSHLVQLRNRCIYTGSARSILRLYRVSRGVFHSCAHFGWFFGIKRLSW